MVRGIEDLRTPLSTILDLDERLRGTLSGFMMPAFVIDLPGGGGKRLVSTYESYKDGVAVYKAPGLPGKKGEREYTYYDPKPVNDAAVKQLRQEQEQALKSDISLQSSTITPRPQQRSKWLPPNVTPWTPASAYNHIPQRTPLPTAARQTSDKLEDLSSHHLAITSSQAASSAILP